MLQMFLNDWVSLNGGMKHLTEPQLRELLEIEVKGKNRTAFLTRIHQRYCKLRNARELDELIREGKLV